MLIGIGMSLMAGLKSSASPASLFANGEVGVWYDPSDVANLAWRYNLLTYTEQFDNAAWTNNGGTVSANALVAPDGTSTADYLVRSSAAGDGRYQVIAAGTSGVCTVSVYIKKDTSNNSLIWLYDATAVADRVFATIAWSGSTPVVTATVGTAATPQDVGNGWWRLSVTSTSLTGANTNRLYFMPAYTGSSNGQQTAFWGAQLETGSTDTAYQMITDVVTQTIANCPNNTLFQDTAGTTPVTAPGQTVGLMLDKSQGLVLGSELWSDTGVTVETGWSQAGSVYSHTAGIGTINKNIGLVTGKTYQVTFTVTGRTAGNIGPVYGGSVSGPTVTANGTYTQRVASGVNVLMYFQPSTDFVGSVSGISVKLLAGNHATQATSTQRPTYGINPIVGTRNLLTYSEQFDNAAWYKDAATISVNAITAPDGTLTADKLVENTATTTHDMYALPATQPIATFTYSLYVKASGRTKFRLQQSSTTAYAVLFDLVALTVTTIAGGAVGAITAVGDNWYRCSMTYTTAVSFAPTLTLFMADAAGSISYTGDGTSGLYIWGAQFEVNSTATAYQKVVSQYEVTEAGVQSVSYLAFDGVDDGMVTNTITPAIDKVQVFAGVRKLSDAAVGIVAEFSSVFTNPGSFVLRAPKTAGVANYDFISGGTASGVATAPSTFAAPITNILTGLGDISGDLATLRANGIQVAQSTADQGTGNYLAYPLYLGRRGGSSLPYNGRLYSLITRFGANLTDGQVTATETWVNSETGAMTWILTQGTWYDDGQWYDTATWNDGV